jgi:UDP-glucose 6-dehydrogenase
MNLGFVVRGDSGTISQYPEGGLIDSLTFRHFVLTKRGDWYYWFVDGKVLATLAVSNVGNIGFAETDPFRVGHGVRTVTSDRMKISLLRVSSDPLSDEQIKYMYEEEKHLFQENAGASLVGTSNTITALAHDKETDLLHVGTSWGRSVFQGLRRIDEDLSHVPQIVIKASNGMIVEE